MAATSGVGSVAGDLRTRSRPSTRVPSAAGLRPAATHLERTVTRDTFPPSKRKAKSEPTPLRVTEESPGAGVVPRTFFYTQQKGARMDTQLSIFCKTMEQWTKFVRDTNPVVNQGLNCHNASLRIAETEITVYSPTPGKPQ